MIPEPVTRVFHFALAADVQRCLARLDQASALFMLVATFCECMEHQMRRPALFARVGRRHANRISMFIAILREAWRRL
jgi:hypothetical protein